MDKCGIPDEPDVGISNAPIEAKTFIEVQWMRFKTAATKQDAETLVGVIIGHAEVNYH